MNAVKVSPHFDTSRSFFNDVTHRKHNQRIQRWVDYLAPGAKTSKRRHASSTNASDPLATEAPSVMSSKIS